MTYIWVTGLLLVIQLIIFKQLYPFGDYVADSYGYIYAAKNNLDVYLWPIGYSKVLSLFHIITHSETALVGFQYLFLEFSALYFFLSTKHFYQLSWELGAFLYAFLFINPLFLYLSNCIGSDALFIGTSLLWITQVIWMLHRPKWYHVITQAVLIWVAFTLRYNALIYPLITAGAFLLSTYSSRLKMIGMALPIICVAIFMNRATIHNGEVTGTRQFSVFGGWQTANNALFLYPHIDLDSGDLTGDQSMALNRMVKHYFDTVAEENVDIDMDRGSYYMWDEHSPMKLYMRQYQKTHPVKDEYIAWGEMAPVFSAYGFYIIKHHPGAYLSYYIWPNTEEYFLPTLEKLTVYNAGYQNGKHVVDSLGMEWFGRKSREVTAVSFTAQRYLLSGFPRFFLITNMLYISALIWFFVIKGPKKAEHYLNRAVLLITIFLLANFAFSVFVSPIVFRYQLFPMIVMGTFALLLLDYAYKSSRNGTTN